ncbi:alpha/beta hydrolase [Microbacterium sp. H83]|uniref:alpha/beta hydrolase n=1 Tax=Microbacterium sp. H83 TaxID=1827324 RepID=UPI0007F4EBC0|nr:alpha/beta hydrolase [Microbacterium sp. H83]OAN41406.1 alpha/beta hydrolase [Microbacterium sp. H83]
MTTANPTKVIFIHGLWLHSTAWQPWVDLFNKNGFDAVAPGWPNEPATVAAARNNPGLVANIGIDDITAHYERIIRDLDEAPVVIGHSFGGLITQKLAGMGLTRAAVAIDPAQIKGVKPLPFAQLRSGLPALGNPANKKRAVSLTEKQFRYGFGNAISEEESSQLFNRWTIPSPARPLFEAASANFSAKSPAKVNTANNTRGPLLLVSGQMDHTVPDVVTRAAFKLYGDSTAVTELKQFADRGHSLTVDSGWKAIADYSLEWLARQGVRGTTSQQTA